MRRRSSKRVTNFQFFLVWFNESKSKEMRVTHFQFFPVWLNERMLKTYVNNQQLQFLFFLTIIILISYWSNPIMTVRKKNLKQSEIDLIKSWISESLSSSEIAKRLKRSPATTRPFQSCDNNSIVFAIFSSFLFSAKVS